jgi:hypothetical protein
LPVPGTKVAGVGRGRDHRRSAYADWPIGKDWLWCHSGPTSPGTGSVHRQLLPSLLLWQPSQSMEETGGRCPCFVWKFSQASGKWRQNMVDLSSSGFRNSKPTASPRNHVPFFELSTGLRATMVWNSPSRTGLSSSQCGASAVMNSRSHPEHMMSRLDNSRHTRQEWGYRESQSPVDLTSLVL